MGCVLGQHDESGRKEHAIYYLSKKFTDCETRYSQLEKTCNALAWAARQLRQYMLTHTTLLISKMEAVLPIEVQIPSTRVLQDAELSEDDWIQTRLDQINLIDEK